MEKPSASAHLDDIVKLEISTQRLKKVFKSKQITVWIVLCAGMRQLSVAGKFR